MCWRVCARVCVCVCLCVSGECLVCVPKRRRFYERKSLLAGCLVFTAITKWTCEVRTARSELGVGVLACWCVEVFLLADALHGDDLSIMHRSIRVLVLRGFTSL